MAAAIYAHWKDGGLMMIWSKLLETYENCSDIVRVAHVALPLSVGVLLDPQGKLLLVQKFEKKEWAESPCTVRSETRTSNICPHILNDKYAYMGGKDKEKHSKYMDQLRQYAENSNHLYPFAVYKYLLRGAALVILRLKKLYTQCNILTGTKHQKNKHLAPAEKLGFFFGCRLVAMWLPFG